MRRNLAAVLLACGFAWLLAACSTYGWFALINVTGQTVRIAYNGERTGSEAIAPWRLRRFSNADIYRSGLVLTKGSCRYEYVLPSIDHEAVPEDARLWSEVYAIDSEMRIDLVYLASDSRLNDRTKRVTIEAERYGYPVAPRSKDCDRTSG